MNCRVCGKFMWPWQGYRFTITDDGIETREHMGHKQL